MFRRLLLVVCLLLAGCGTAPSGDTGNAGVETETVTPAPVPNPLSATPAGTVAPDKAVGLRPTCERSPGRVVEIQVAALRAADRAAGINTTWRFTAPSSRRLYESRAAFRDLLVTSFGDLLNATTVAFGPTVVVGEEAWREVRIGSGEQPETFRWRLERQRGGRYDGCWMSVSVTRERDRRAGPSG